MLYCAGGFSSSCYGRIGGVCNLCSIETVLEEAEKKKAYEEEREKRIAAYRTAKAEGKPLPQLAPNWVLEKLSGN